MGILRKKNKRSLNPTLIALFLAISCVAALSNGCNCGGQKASKLNLLLVTIDGMGANRIGPKTRKPMEMPVLDRLWTQGTTFTRVVTASSLRGPSYSSLFTGLYPPGHGVHDDRTDKLPADAITMAEILKKAGYNTGAVTSNIDTMDFWGFNQGFDYYDDEVTRSLFDSGLPAPEWAQINPASSVTTQAVKWIADVSSDKKPWFLWVEYSDALPPRNVKTPFLELFPGSPYAASLSYIDANLGALLGKLRDLRMSENTLIVITAPQNQPIGEHGESKVIMFAYMATVNVPAIFVLPGKIPPGKEITTQVSSVDLEPTILGLLKIPAPRKIDGRNMALSIIKNKALKTRPVYSENYYASRWFGWKPVASVISGDYQYLDMSSPELYDLLSDPSEQSNIALKDKDLSEDMIDKLKSLLKNMEGHQNGQESQVESEVENQLTRLGYITPDDKRLAEQMKNLPKAEILSILQKMQDARKAVYTNKRDVAIQEYQKLIKDYPGFGWAYYELGELLKANRDLSAAEAMYKKGIAVGAYYIRAAAMVGMAQMMAYKKQMMEAENLLKIAIQLIPNNAEVYINLGNVYLVEESPDDAERMFRKAIELDPESYRAHFGLASVFMTNSKRAPAAVSELEYVFKYYPDYPPAHLMFARIAMQFGNKAEAEKRLKKVVELSPQSSAATQAKALLEKLNEPEQAPQPAPSSQTP